MILWSRFKCNYRTFPIVFDRHIKQPEILDQWFLTGFPDGMPKRFLVTLICANNNDHHFD